LLTNIFAPSSNGKESENPVLDPDADLDRQRNDILLSLSWAKSNLPWKCQPNRL